MAAAKHDKILIIGAGLGGLALAQILWHHEVPFEIFDRDQQPSARKQGWAVALIESRPELEKLVDPKLAERIPTNSVVHNLGENDEVGFVRALTGEKVGNMGGAPPGQPNPFLRVAREKLRNFLWTVNDLPVSSGKHFTHYVEDNTGVTAHFADGSTARGSLLVGADGLHSAVMKQMLGPAAPSPTLSRHIPIFGEVDLPAKLFEPLRKWANAMILTGSPGVRMQIGTWSISDDRSTGRFFWAVMPSAKNPQELWDWVENATKQQLYDYVLEITKDWDRGLTDPIRYGGPAAIIDKQIKFEELILPETLPDGRVTLLGDSAHSMIPFRGAGANTAILDACDLGKMVIKALEEGIDPATVLSEYHKILLPRGKQNVLMSRAAGEGDGDPADDWARIYQRPKKA